MSDHEDGEEARHHRHRLSGQIHENTGICTADIADPMFVLTPEALAARDARVAATARADALDAVLARAYDGIEFGPDNTRLLRRIVRDVRPATEDPS